jgi:hypothetical protein
MRFIVNQDKKIIFGWSPKCGCTHIKNMVYFLENIKISKLHHGVYDTYELPSSLEEYIIIIVIRNPYKRIVSGIMDKYKLNGELRHLWTIDTPLSFSNFIDKLSEANYEVVEHEHFCQQTDGWFREDIKTHKKLVIFDLEKINYEYIGSLYCKIIPKHVIDFKGNHINNNTIIMDQPVFDLTIDEISSYKISIENFYNEEITEKIKTIYKNDFDFFESKGFTYLCQSKNDLIQDESIKRPLYFNYLNSKKIHSRLKPK